MQYRLICLLSIFILRAITIESLSEICSENSEYLIPKHNDSDLSINEILKKNVHNNYEKTILENLDSYLSDNEYFYTNYDNKENSSDYKYVVKIYAKKNEALVVDEFNNKNKISATYPTSTVGFLTYEHCIQDDDYIYVLFNQNEEFIPISNPNIITKLGTFKSYHVYLYLVYLSTIIENLADQNKVITDFDVNSILVSDDLKKVRIGKFNDIKEFNSEDLKKSILNLIKSVLYFDPTYIPYKKFDPSINLAEAMNSHKITLNSLNDEEEVKEFINKKCEVNIERIEEEYRKKIANADAEKKNFYVKNFIDLITDAGIYMSYDKHLQVKEEFWCNNLQNLYKGILSTSQKGENNEYGNLHEYIKDQKILFKPSINNKKSISYKSENMNLENLSYLKQQSDSLLI